MRKVSLFSIKEAKPPKSILKPLSKPPSQPDLTKQEDKTDDSANTDHKSSSFYGIVAASKISKDLKKKSKDLMKQRRKRGDWGEYDITQAWSPEELVDSSHSISCPNSRLEREATGASDLFVNMARPCVMAPVKPFQVQNTLCVIRLI